MHDAGAGYGWVSIALHWVTGAIVVVLLFIGSSIAAADGAEYGRMMRLHTSIAGAAYLLLWLRIVWRVRQGHPGPLPGQRGVFFTLGRWVHAAMLVALATLLLSGPLMVWAGGRPIEVFDWFVVPSPLEPSFRLWSFLHAAHGGAAIVVAVSIGLHVLGVYKHTAFNQDGTFGKMLTPAKPGSGGDGAG